MTSDIEKQLIMIRKWSEVSGTLHEAQIAHLKLYWALLTNESGKTIAVDFDQKILEFQMPATGKIVKKYHKSFVDGVRFIVGDAWALRYKQGKKYINV